MTKKIIILFSFAIVALLGVGIYSYTTIHEKDKEIEELKVDIPDAYTYLDSITVDSFNNKKKSKESFVVYVGRPDCPDCSIFEPVFKEFILENGLQYKIQYMNIRDYRAADKDKWEAFKKENKFQQTPAILKIENGQVVSSIDWKDDEGLPINDVKSWLEEQKIM